MDSQINRLFVLFLAQYFYSTLTLSYLLNTWLLVRLANDYFIMLIIITYTITQKALPFVRMDWKGKEGKPRIRRRSLDENIECISPVGNDIIVLVIAVNVEK